MTKHPNDRTDATPWTSADLARAEALWAAGASASEIARKLGRTRNAIIGQARRSGWGKHRCAPTAPTTGAART